MRSIGVGILCLVMAVLAVQATAHLEQPALFGVAGVAAWLLVACGVDFVLRGFGVPGEGVMRGRRAIVRGFVLLAINFFLMPALVFLLLLTKESGSGWTLAVFVVLLSVLAVTAWNLFAVRS